MVLDNPYAKQLLFGAPTTVGIIVLDIQKAAACYQYLQQQAFFVVLYDALRSRASMCQQENLQQ